HILNGCSFGPQCKLSGEISNSIILGYSNKQHYGFLGSSYIGEWVNFGAGTTNSNLKNNYSEITLYFNEKRHCTGLKFLGVLCGDHVKTAVGTMLNTGTIIGVGANIFKPGLTDKYIPSFSWGPGEKYSFDKFLKTARIVMERREKSMPQSSEELLESIFQKS
ncbi:glucose-1-phosphate thymidylyltransferase, partial [candidate division WOR-3 bacterium]|nr:glucose-1-phosphate thymidylyltransferase [candidate division WOR-3 bacterium]